MKSLRKQAFYDDLSFEVFEDVYEPAEDTFLVADYLARVVNEGDTVLDVGTGCGILATIAAKKAMKVVATDVNPHAVECTRFNANDNGVADKVEVRLGDLFQPIHKDEKFDAIVFNAPYLPTPQREQNTWLGRAWAGGPLGRLLVDRFTTEAPVYLKENGKILLVQSSLSNVEETLQRFRSQGLRAQVVAEKKVSFETIVVVEASHVYELLRRK